MCAMHRIMGWVISVVVLGAAPAVHAEGGDSAHHGPHQEDVKLRALKPGEKWPTDAALRQGMEDVRATVLAAQADIAADRLDAASYARLADSLEQRLAAIVKNCKLTPEADAAFHSVVLGPLTHDVGTLRDSPKADVKKVAVLGMTQTLRHYGEYFQHPGWGAKPAPAR